MDRFPDLHPFALSIFEYRAIFTCLWQQYQLSRKTSFSSGWALGTAHWAVPSGQCSNIVKILLKYCSGWAVLKHCARLLLPQLIPHRRLQRGQICVQFPKVQFFGERPSDNFGWARPGCWRLLRSCGLPRRWRVALATSQTA